MKKKFLSGLIALAVAIPCAFGLVACDKKTDDETPAPAPAMVFDEWDGTLADVSEAVSGVITIDSAKEFAGLADSVNEGTDYDGVTIKLTCNIDLKNIEWTPIGFGSSTGAGTLDDEEHKWFKGDFDGQNHTIKNLKVTEFTGGELGDTEAASGVALFGHVHNGSVKNLIIDTARVDGNHFVAAVVGFSLGTTIENVSVKNADINCTFANDDESGDKAAVVVAFAADNNESNSLVKNCSATNCTVEADRDAGQIVGCAQEYTYETTSVVEDNTASNVVVSYNGDVDDKHSSKSNTNINNEIIGRDILG